MRQGISILLFILLLFASPLGVFAESTTALSSESIQFSSDEVLSTQLLIKVVLASILALSVGFIAIWIIKKKGAFVGMPMVGGKHSIELLAHRKINTKISTTLVSVDDVCYLIAQSNGAISVVKHEVNSE